MKEYRLKTRMLTSWVVTVVLMGLVAPSASPQDDSTVAQGAAQAEQATTTTDAAGSAVPRLVRFSGLVTDGTGKVQTGVLGLTFALYQEQTGGVPLWVETQKVQLDDQGRYTVLLGATQAEGLPLDLFTSGKARWLGVTPHLPAVGEQPRVLLVGVPYALKAADAETLGGKPASAFLTTQAAPSLTDAGTQAVIQSLSVAAGAASVAQNPGPLAITGSGTPNFIPIWTSSTNLGNSTVSEVGGTVNVKGTLQLPATGTATAAKGFNSQPLDSIGSSFSSTLSVAVNQHFRLQVEPVGNNTPSPSGKISLLYAPGTGTPAETGLSIAKNGRITFASGQTFPGTGTITGVTAGTDLTGGGTTGTVTLNLNVAATDARYARLGTANTFVGNQSITGNLSDSGNISATGSVSGGSASFSGAVSGGNGTFSGNVSGANLTTSGTVSGKTGSFTGNVSGANLSAGGTVSGATGSFTGEVTANEFFADTNSTEAVVGISTVSNGVYGESDHDSGFQAATLGWEFGSTQETLGLWGFTASAIGAGVYGESVNSSTVGSGIFPNAGVWGDTGNIGNDGVLGTADDAFPMVAFNNSTIRTTSFFENETTGSSTAPIFRTVNNFFGGACTIDVSGDLSCTGSKSAVVPADNGTRKVALYAVESPQNWFEDFGSGTLAGGVAAVTLEPTFAQTVNTAMEYHVFLTPKGDCKGLYVANETPASFEVHELGGGQSNVAFDYRIVAHRKGYESVRLADKTKEFGYPAPDSVRKAQPTKPPIPSKRAKPAVSKLAAANVQPATTHK